MSKFKMEQVVLTDEDKNSLAEQATEIKDIRENLPAGIKVPEFIEQRDGDIRSVLSAAGTDLVQDGDSLKPVRSKGVKRKLTPEELSAIRSRASLMRKSHGGGRPRGSKSPRKTKPEETTTISVSKSSYLILKEMAYRNDLPIKVYFSLLMKRVKEEFNPGA